MSFQGENSYTFNAMLMVIQDLYNLITPFDFGLVLLFYIGDGHGSEAIVFNSHD